MSQYWRASWLWVWVVALSVSWADPSGKNVRIRDLRQYVGQSVTIQGRTGHIVETATQIGSQVFTLRDDYGDEVWVCSSAEYPIFGATYRITGMPQLAESRVYLVE